MSKRLVLHGAYNLFHETVETNFSRDYSNHNGLPKSKDTSQLVSILDRRGYYY